MKKLENKEFNKKFYAQMKFEVYQIFLREILHKYENEIFEYYMEPILHYEKIELFAVYRQIDFIEIIEERKNIENA